jgi:transglutaminase-like putative cysteine protease
MTRRARELETLVLTSFAAMPLYLTEAVGTPSLLAFHTVMLGIFVRVLAGKGPELIPARLMRVLAIAYVPFYVIDAALISRSAIAASTHLVFFIAAYQPVESMRNPNQAQRLLTSALIFTASLATSTHITITLFVIAFAWLMFRQLMYVAHLETARSLDREYAEAPSGRAAVFYLAGATLIGALLFPFLPRVRNPIVQGLSGALPGATTALSDSINFNEQRINSNDGTVVARVWMNQQTIPFFTPLRLRGAIYDRFQEGEWKQSRYGMRPLTPRDGTYVLARPGGISRTAVVQERPMRGRLFVPVGTYSIEGLSNLSEGPTRDAYNFFQIRSGELVTFNANMATGAESLRITRVPPLNYPAQPEIVALARQITGNEQRLERRAAAIERYLSTRFTYAADPTTLPRGMTVEQFLLREHRGHCEYFAAGMVVLLSSIDVPARMVGGFYGGRLNPLTGYFTVRREDAHAWVEVWDGARWLTYDPTPALLRPGNANEGLVRVYLSAISDSINYFWDRYILTYGLSDQIALIADTLTRARDAALLARQSLAEGVRQLRGAAFVIVLAVMLIAGLAFIAFARRRRPLFDLLAAHLARLGIRVSDAMTMEDALRELRARYPEQAALLEPLVRLYEEEEFSASRDASRRRAVRRGLAELEG